ncbi:MAG: RNA polymerase sigma factor [Phycisphaerae bacterium]|nr:RNA polymerase sigma factor [Phycisphaerae bacterium]
MAGSKPLSPDELSALSDEELACRAQAGSSACFGELVSRHENRLLRFLVRRTGHVQDAEDLLQETFARAYQRIQLYKPAWKVTTWLFTIASRLVCSHFRKSKEQLLPSSRNLRPGQTDPAEIVSGREEKENLWALAAEVLSENQHLALWLRYAEEMSVKEISQVMDKTQTHVKVLLFRGRSCLARKLRPVEVPDRLAGAPCPAGRIKGGR